MGNPRSKDDELKALYAECDAKLLLKPKELAAWRRFLAGGSLESIAEILGKPPAETNAWLDAQSRMRPYRSLDGTPVAGKKRGE